MLIICWSDKVLNVKILFTINSKCFSFFSNKSMSCMKTLFDFLPWSVDHYGTSRYTKVLFNCVCNTPNFVIQQLWKYKCSFFSQLKIIFKDLTDLGQLTNMRVLIICIVFSKTTRNWILVFWFPKSVDKNIKYQQGTWNTSSAKRSSCE